MGRNKPLKGMLKKSPAKFVDLGHRMRHLKDMQAWRKAKEWGRNNLQSGGRRLTMEEISSFGGRGIQGYNQFWSTNPGGPGEKII